jgi:excisionase family DNA binding protein
MSLIQQDYYTVEEFAAIQKVHHKTVYRWVKDGLAPKHELLGRMYFFEKAAANAWKKPTKGRKRHGN